jgi:hypothetical protein
MSIFHFIRHRDTLIYIKKNPKQTNSFEIIQNIPLVKFRTNIELRWMLISIILTHPLKSNFPLIVSVNFENKAYLAYHTAKTTKQTFFQSSTAQYDYNMQRSNTNDRKQTLPRK